MSKQRIATVKATGDRYIVQRMSFAQDASQARVFTWGEVVAYKTQRAFTREEALTKLASTTHEHGGGKVFLLSAVDVVEVEVTGRIARELLEQGARKSKAPITTSFRRR